MKSFFLLLVLAVTTNTLMAQTNLELGRDYIIEQDYKNPKENILVGQVDDFILTEFDTEGWYTEGKEYEPNQETLSEITDLLDGYEIFVFLGTWCGDTKHLLPQFMSVMQSADFNSELLKMYAVKRDKNALNIEREIFEIDRIPTFIFYKNNMEVGRIVESVEKDIESSILDILERK